VGVILSTALPAWLDAARPVSATTAWLFERAVTCTAPAPPASCTVKPMPAKARGSLASPTTPENAVSSGSEAVGGAEAMKGVLTAAMLPPRPLTARTRSV
jgi:hypothetical protein